MKTLKKTIALASVLTLTTATNIFAATKQPPKPTINFGEIVLGVGVGLLVAYVMKTMRNGKKTKTNGMYDGKGAKVPPMQNKKKKKKK